MWKFGGDAIRVRTDPCLSKTQRTPLERSLKTLFFVFGNPTCKQRTLLEREAKRAWVLSDYCEENSPAITLPVAAIKFAALVTRWRPMFWN
jgi:hypothetical protein